MREAKELKKLKRKAKKKGKKKRQRKLVDLLTLRKTARAGAISIWASCLFNKIKSKRNHRARRSMSKHLSQSLSAYEMTSH